MTDKDFKTNIKTFSNKELLEQMDFMADGYYSDLVEVCLEELRCRLDATRWHYPSRGEYPPKGRQILAYAWNVHNVLAKYDTFDGEDKFVTFDAYNGFIEIEGVIRWQYIEPPKEEVSNL